MYVRLSKTVFFLHILLRLPQIKVSKKFWKCNSLYWLHCAFSGMHAWVPGANGLQWAVSGMCAWVPGADGLQWAVSGVFEWLPGAGGLQFLGLGLYRTMGLWTRALDPAAVIRKCLWKRGQTLPPPPPNSLGDRQLKFSCLEMDGLTKFLTFYCRVRPVNSVSIH